MAVASLRASKVLATLAYWKRCWRTKLVSKEAMRPLNKGQVRDTFLGGQDLFCSTTPRYTHIIDQKKAVRKSRRPSIPSRPPHTFFSIRMPCTQTSPNRGPYHKAPTTQSASYFKTPKQQQRGGRASRRLEKGKTTRVKKHRTDNSYHTHHQGNPIDGHCDHFFLLKHTK